MLRTAPSSSTDALLVCTFVAVEMGYTRLVVINRNDAYGDGYKDALVVSCHQHGAEVTPFGFSSDNIAGHHGVAAAITEVAGV